MAKYSIGLDYGTLSVRALLVDVDSGAEIATAEFVYPHGVFGEKEVCGQPSKTTTALQHPQDYLDGFSAVVKEVIARSKVDAKDVVGLGIDFTSSTVIATTEDGTPICFIDEFKNEPHAYVKLWKHHGASKEAEELTALAKERGEKWLDGYGGKISSEMLFPKMIETLNNAPAVFNKADKFLDAGEWLALMITNNDARSCCMAGYKALWNKKNGYPKNEFFIQLNPALNNIVGTKISEKVLPVCAKFGELNAFGATLSGLNQGLPIAVPVIDAHAAMPAAGVVEEGEMMLILGTSSVQLLHAKEDKEVKGICGSVCDSVAPGCVTYEAGQAGFGDNVDWFIKNCIPESYTAKAREEKRNIFDLLNEKAQKLKVGESGLLALDWWNGNRTPYADYDLTGMILGFNLHTKPEEIYRAIIESLAFGARGVMDCYINAGLTVKKITAAGGIAGKNPFLMQIFADVLGLEISVVESKQAGAKGSAIYAAVAGGVYKTLIDACKNMADKIVCTYFPNSENNEKYNLLYKEYQTLCDYFATKNDVMKKIKTL